MKKSPMSRMGQFQAGLALAMVLLLGLGLLAPWSVNLIALQLACIVGGAIALLALLISAAIGYATEAIVLAVKERESVD